MLRVETTMHLPAIVKYLCQRTARPKNCLAAPALQRRPVCQQRIEVGPAVQGAGHQDRAAFAIDPSLTKIDSLQGRDLQLLIAADVAELTGERWLAKRAAQGPPQVIALPLEVKPFALQLQPVDAAPATPAGIGLVNGVELHLPKLFEGIQAMALKQRLVGLCNEIPHSRPSKKLRMWRMRRLSDALSRARLRYCR
ncbi:hypothetical protein D9M71_581620 [compost metagenome]